MIRPALSALMASVLFQPVLVHAAADSPPTRPGNVQAKLYTGAGGELFWQRSTDDRGVRGYEISKNGKVVASRDATSYYDASLKSGTRYAFTVTAIDTAGQRSPVASVSIGGTASAPAPARPAPAPQPSGTADFAPTNASITVYSSTAAELFWTPAGSARPVIQKNEIRRDGVLIGTTGGEFARSFFDNTRLPGQSHTYEITAVSAAGRASVGVVSPGSGAAPPASAGAQPQAPVSRPAAVGPSLPASIKARLDTEFELLNGTALERVAATALRLSDSRLRGARNSTLPLRLTGSRNDPESPYLRLDTYACPQGGTLQDISNADGSTPASDTRFTAEDCGIGPIVVSGRFSINGGRMRQGRQERSTYLTADAVELDDARDSSTTTVGLSVIEFGSTGPSQLLWMMADVRVDDTTRSYSAQQVYGDGVDEGNALPDGSLGLTVQSRGIGGAFGNGEQGHTRGPFEFGNGRANGHPTAGRFSIRAGSNSYHINAFNGDGASFLLTATENGSTVSYTVPWSATYQLEAPEVRGVNVGF